MGARLTDEELAIALEEAAWHFRGAEFNITQLTKFLRKALGCNRGGTAAYAGLAFGTKNDLVEVTQESAEGVRALFRFKEKS